jgi:hypothetical protein
MATLELLRVDDFTGGLNLRADQFQLAPNESPRMLNVEIDPRGGVFSRGGMRRITSQPIVGGNIITEGNDTLQLESGDLFTPETISDWTPEVLFPFEGIANYLMLSTGASGATDGNVYYSTGSDFTSLAVPVKNEHGCGFAEWGDFLFMTPGLGAQCRRWNGTTLTTLNSTSDATGGIYTAWGAAADHMPQSRHILTHAGKTFVAYTREFNGTGGSYTDYPNRIRWSDENAPTRWTSANYIDINDGGTGITAIASFNGTLLVFKATSVYAIYGYNSDTFQVVELSKRVGTITSHSVATTERGVYFFSWPDGLFVYTGSSILDLFEPIRPIIQTSQVNTAYIDEIYVNYVNRRIWVSLPYSDAGGATLPTTSFVYDPSIGSSGDAGESFGVNDAFSGRGSWTMFRTADGYGVAGGCTFVTSSGQVIHAVAHPVLDAVAGVDVYTQQTDNFDGSDVNFESYYRTRWMDAGNYSMKKMWRRPDFVLKQKPTARDLIIDVYHDYEEAAGSQKRTFNLNIAATGSGALWGFPPTGNMTWGSSSWGPPNEGAFMETGSNLGLARAVQLEITGPTGLSWGVDSFTVKFNPRRVRG